MTDTYRVTYRSTELSDGSRVAHGRYETLAEAERVAHMLNTNDIFDDSYDARVEKIRARAKVTP